MADDHPLKDDPFHFLEAVSLSSQDLAQRLVRSGLVDKQAIQLAWKDLPDGERSTSGLAKALTVSAKLTPFQIRKVADEADPLLIIGGYVIQDKLGEGGMGQVYRALHRKMKREVALKVISSRLLKDTHAIARFNREVEAAAKLSHPNIISSFDAGESEGIHYLVMEYIVGTDLTSRVREGGTMSLVQAVAATFQAAQGLAYAHAQGIVHRDIKPSNLLIDRTGVVRVLDLGLARIEQAEDASMMDGLTKTGSVMGTVDYMAPEQAMDSKTADARSDIYSLGCTLFFLITGSSVFDGDTLVKRLLAHRNMPVPTLSKYSRGVTPRLDAIFSKMLAKQPESRYQSMSEVVRELEAVLPELDDAGEPQVSAPNLSFAETMPSSPLDETLGQHEPVGLGSSIEIQIQPSQPRSERTPRPSKLSARSLYLIAAGALTVSALLALGIYRFSADADNQTVAAQPAEPIDAATKVAASNPAPAQAGDARSTMVPGSRSPGSAAADSNAASSLPMDNAAEQNTAEQNTTERSAAEWFARELVAGYVHLRLSDDSLVELTPAQRTLPSTPFVVEALRFVDGQIDDAGLGHLKACRFLKELNLSRSVFPSTFADRVWLNQAFLKEFSGNELF